MIFEEAFALYIGSVFIFAQRETPPSYFYMNYVHLKINHCRIKRKIYIRTIVLKNKKTKSKISYFLSNYAGVVTDTRC